jgi:head-tail adaptor
MDDLPQKKTPDRAVLTKSEATGELGRELINLIRGWLAGGKFERQGLEELEAWLAKAPQDSLAAIHFLREQVTRAMADGNVQDWHLRHLHDALLRVLPPKERDVAKAERIQLNQSNWLREQSERASREQSERATQEHNAETMAHEPASVAQLNYIDDLGGHLPASSSQLEASELIQKLKDERWRAYREDNAESWAHEPATERQLGLIRQLGGNLQASSSKLEASALIDKLMHRERTPLKSLTKKGSGCLVLLSLILVVGLIALLIR